MIHIVIWGKLQVLNEVLVPGRGKLIGWDVKRDFFNPIDLVPFVGPISKLNKARKVLKNRSKIKYYVVGGLGLAADVFAVKEAVQWYNARYRIFEEASSPAARSGNAVGPGGGTKITYTGQSGRRTNGRSGKFVRCKYHRVRNRRTGGWTWALGRKGPQCVKHRSHSGKHAVRWKSAFGKGK